MKFKHLLITAGICLSSVFAAKAQSRKAIEFIQPVNKAAEDTTMTGYQQRFGAAMTTGGFTSNVNNYARVMHRLGYHLTNLSQQNLSGYAIVISSSSDTRADTTMILVHALSADMADKVSFDIEKIVGQDLTISSGDKNIYVSKTEPDIEQEGMFAVTKTFYKEDGTILRQKNEVVSIQIVLKELKAIRQDPTAFIAADLKSPPAKKPKPTQ